MVEFYPEGRLIDNFENKNSLMCLSSLVEAYNNKKILESKAIMCDKDHNLIVDLGCMKGIIPRDEGALGIKEGLVRDIAVISKVNRPVCLIITGFQKMNMAKNLRYYLVEKPKKFVCKNIFLTYLLEILSRQELLIWKILERLQT